MQQLRADGVTDLDGIGAVERGVVFETTTTVDSGALERRW